MKNKIQKIGWGFGSCNMNCAHCYNASTGHQFNYALNDLKKIADKICNQKINDINFGTGELLVNPNALKVARYIKEKYPQVKLGLTTNGYSAIYMDEKILKKTFHDIDVSIDFPSKQKHNQFRQHPMAWDWANQALATCQRLGIESSIVTCATSKTEDEDILKLLKIAKKYGTSLRINWFRPTGRGKKEFCLSPLRFWRIIHLLAQHAIFEGLSDPLLQTFFAPKIKHHCACGWTSARIQQDMTVTPCVFLKGQNWASGHILKNSLEKIYKHKNFRAIRLRKPTRCLKCPYYAGCQGGCASRAYLQGGGLDKEDAYCPLKDKRTIKLIEKIKKILTVRDSHKVHNGYLCTLIIKPK